MNATSFQPFPCRSESAQPTRGSCRTNRQHIVRAGSLVRPMLMLCTAGGVAFLVGSMWSLVGREGTATAAHPTLQGAAKPAAASVDLALAKENLAWLLGDRQSFSDAVKSFNNAIQAGGPKPEYLVGRGRCYYKQAIGLRDLPVLTDAANDLQKAIEDQKLPKGDTVEALFWLGLVYAKKIPPADDEVKKYLNQAAKLAEEEKSFKGTYAYGLEAIAQWGEFNLEKASKQGGSQTLQTAIDQFERLGQFAQECGNEKHQFWAWNRLRYIGERFYEAQNQPRKAFNLYQKGLPPDVTKATEAHVRLLNIRNALLAKPNEKFQQELKDVQKPSPEELIRDAEHCLKLVARKPRHQWLSDQDEMEANLAAAFCYHNGKDKTNALKYLQIALSYPQDPTVKPILEKFQEDWRKE